MRASTTGLAAVALRRHAVVVGLGDSIDMADGQALPAHVRPDQRGVDMHDLASGDLRRHAGQHRSLKDAPEALGAPALADTGQRRMIGQGLVQSIADEPADREIDLRLPHQPPVMHDPEQEPSKHQPDRDFRIDPRPPVRLAVKVGDLRPKPGEVEHAIDSGEDMIVGHELPQRPRHKQLKLIAFLPSEHAAFP
jgi:hypothetical protein